ncbi:hypothetical protein Tco_0248021 [Tanacetum coccineum]
MVNDIPLDYVDDVPVVEPNQHDDVPIVPEPVLEDEDEDPEEDEFKEEEDPQEEEDDMEIDIKEDENEPELTYPYEEVDPLNPSPPASESEPDDEIEVENPIEHEDETVPVSVYEVGESYTTVIPREDGDRLLPGFMRQDIESLFDLRNEVSSSMEQGTTAMEKLVEKLGNVEEKAECKKLKKELEEARLSNTFLSMPNERVERDLYWTRVRAHEFYQEMIHRGFMFEERLNETINVLIDDEKSPSSEPQGSPFIDAAIAAERERQAKVRNDASGSGPVRFQDTTLVVHECTFDVFMKCNPTGKKVRFIAATLEGPTLTWWNSKIATLGLMDNIKGEVTSSKPADLNEVVRMAHKLMEQNSQARNERILEAQKRKWEIFQSGNTIGKGNQRDNSRQTLQNNQKQGNARAVGIIDLMRQNE